ncbi:RING finger protein [Trypanosoma conorhini]|uniref:RBR-type E3 ubiquitin transferase n=1 Tax=Trypanosoma conorhini TaxID=83891 RepID=A0A422NFE2_9TRYP|nr:RING finger protein [Trypanosoma conorhini]RNF04194.1 RING finger protein [Trypanosoma conorhini]
MSYTEEEYYDIAEYTVDCDGCDDDQWALVPPSAAERPLADARANARLFTTLSTSGVLAGLQSDVEKANEILGLTPEAALLVLRYYGWKMDDATLEKYFAEMDEVNEKLRITEAVFRSGGAGAELVRGNQSMECPICGDDVPAEETVGLASCRHFLCIECLTTNLICAVKYGHDLLDKRCPTRGCCSIVGLNLFKALLPPKEYGQAERRFLNDYVGGNTHMRFCPNVTPCAGVIRVAALRESGPEVCCDICALEFCFKCLQAPHAPATCAMVQNWAKLLQENEPSLALIQETTKGCPKCFVRVEKNLGCNHMKCTRCQHEYCWICLGPWSEHNANFYNCNNVRQAEVKNEKNMLLDYYERWDNHKRSIAMETNLLQESSEKVRKLAQYHKGPSTSGKTLSLLYNTRRVLRDCRVVLMNAYVVLFFSGTAGSSLHYRIHQLELRTEETSRLIDAPPELLDVDEIESRSHQAMHWCNVLRREGFD